MTRFVGDRSVAWGAALLLVAVVLAANPGAFLAGDLQETEGDLAANALLVRDAQHLRLLTGPYSRFGWNHPGPLLFYGLAGLQPLLAPVPSPCGRLRLAQLLITAAFLGLTLREGIRLRSRRRDGPWLMLGLLAAVLPIASGGLHPLVEIWGPLMVLAPFALLSVAVANLASGEGRPLPWVLLGATACMQTHVALVLPVIVLLALGTTGWCMAGKQRRQPGRGARRLSAVVVVVAVVPVAVDLLLSITGNPGRLLAFLLAPHEGNTLATSFSALGWSWTHPARTLLPGLLGGLAPVQPVFRATTIILLLLAAAAGARVGGPRLRWLVATAVLGLAAALAGGMLSADDLQAHLYFFHFANVLVGLLVFAGLIGLEGAIAAVVRDPKRQRRLVRASAAAALALALGLTAWQRVPPRRPPLDYAGLVAALAVGRSDSLWLHLDWGGRDHELWPHLMGLTLAGERRGAEVRLDPAWRTMAGPRRTLRPESAERGLLLAGVADDSSPLGAAQLAVGNLLVYAFSPAHWTATDLHRIAGLLGKPPLPLGHTAGPDDPSLFFTGFSSPEGRWIWSLGTRSEVAFRWAPAAAVSDSVALTVIAGTLDTQTVGLELEGHDLGTRQLAGFDPGNWMVTVPTHWLRRDRPAALIFHCPQAHRPAQGDSRLLGVDLHGLRLDPVVHVGDGLD